EGGPVHPLDHLLAPLVRRHQKQRDGDIQLAGDQPLIRSSPEQIDVLLSISNAATIALPSSHSTSIRSMVWVVTRSNCCGSCSRRRGISPSRCPFHTRLWSFLATWTSKPISAPSLT